MTIKEKIDEIKKSDKNAMIFIYCIDPKTKEEFFVHCGNEEREYNKELLSFHIEKQRTQNYKSDKEYFINGYYLEVAEIQNLKLVKFLKNN